MLNVARGGIEPPTRGFSVQSLKLPISLILLRNKAQVRPIFLRDTAT